MVITMGFSPPEGGDMAPYNYGDYSLWLYMTGTAPPSWPTAVSPHGDKVAALLLWRTYTSVVSGDQEFWLSYFAINHQFCSIILWIPKNCRKVINVRFLSCDWILLKYDNLPQLLKYHQNLQKLWIALPSILTQTPPKVTNDPAPSLVAPMPSPQRPQALIPRLKTTEFLGFTMWPMFAWVS